MIVHDFRGFSAWEGICPSKLSSLPRPESMSHMRHRFGTSKNRIRPLPMRSLPPTRHLPPLQYSPGQQPV